jgi:hypothetical protein
LAFRATPSPVQEKARAWSLLRWASVAGGCLPSNLNLLMLTAASPLVPLRSAAKDHRAPLAARRRDTAYRSSSVSPSFRPRIILRERLSANAIAYRRTSPLVIAGVEQKANRRASRYMLWAALQVRLGRPDRHASSQASRSAAGRSVTLRWSTLVSGL